MIRKRYKSIIAEFINNELIQLVGVKDCDNYIAMIDHALDLYNKLNLDYKLKLILNSVTIYITNNKTKNELVREFEDEYFLSTGIMVE